MVCSAMLVKISRGAGNRSGVEEVNAREPPTCGPELERNISANRLPF